MGGRYTTVSYPIHRCHCECSSRISMVSAIHNIPESRGSETKHTCPPGDVIITKVTR